jgi:cysteine desulfurase
MDGIYLDHNATTPPHPEVVQAVARCSAQGLANPASQHRPGQAARGVLESAREQIAEILGVDLAAPRRDRLIFTSGGTEANNLAILGTAAAGGGQPGQIVISLGEHPSVIEPAEHLLEQGWRLDTLGMTPDGVVRVEQLPPLFESPTKDPAQRDCDDSVDAREPVALASPRKPADERPGKPRLVSVSLGNHETGVLQPVAELAAICRAAGVPLHTDAVQVVGKLPVSFRDLGASAMTVAAHKFRGPLGIGALIVERDLPLGPLMFGGHQQSGLRPGTESVALAVGMATALELWRKEQDEHARRLTAQRDRFEQSLRTALPEVIFHGAASRRLPQTSSVAFPGVDGEVFRMALDLAGVACSVGSACSSGSTELSPTLRAMGLPSDLLASSLRFSFGATTTPAEIDEAVRRIARVFREVGR